MTGAVSEEESKLNEEELDAALLDNERVGINV